MPSQSGGFLQWSDCISRQGKVNDIIILDFSVRPLTWSCTTSLSLSCRDMDLKDALFDKILTGWLQPERCGQLLYVFVEASDEWCPSGSHLGTGVL